MPFISAAQCPNPNVPAFLDMLAWSELGSDYLSRSDNGYNIIVTGTDGKMETFTGYADHPFAAGRPSKVINSKGLTSNAAGRYQQMLRDWPHYKAQLKLPDFGKLSQDLLAIQHIRECRALAAIASGNIPAAIAQCANIWASLPGNAYGQPVRPTAALLARYQAAGGVLAV
jgi:muramidase (phage lysozyme)